MSSFSYSSQSGIEDEEIRHNSRLLLEKMSKNQNLSTPSDTDFDQYGRMTINGIKTAKRYFVAAAIINITRRIDKNSQIDPQLFLSVVYSDVCEVTDDLEQKSDHFCYDIERYVISNPRLKPISYFYQIDLENVKNLIFEHLNKNEIKYGLTVYEQKVLLFDLIKKYFGSIFDPEPTNLIYSTKKKIRKLLRNEKHSPELIKIVSACKNILELPRQQILSGFLILLKSQSEKYNYEMRELLDYNLNIFFDANFFEQTTLLFKICCCRNETRASFLKWLLEEIADKELEKEMK
ncbi:hypothetical protein M153_3200036758 [Pseudoloma neurophilia]|uniref:Uncharacterized protein n=1 Tax=Pseudoloma neurophilia TaxID=146866 RepID=A0A0R0M0P0_9MICR|nr:hypothetical protein M153_3200036758 [Pseudoloma neurophilia]